MSGLRLQTSPTTSSAKDSPHSVSLPLLIPGSVCAPTRPTTSDPTRFTTSDPSPSGPTTPTESTFYRSSYSFTRDPWSIRVASLRNIPRTPRSGSSSLENSTELQKMNSSGTMKRKVVIMGSPSVGKTSLTQQYVAPPTYIESYFPTIEATSHKHVTFDGVDYTCEIIDSAGQDEYTLFPSKYAVGVHGYLLVYSINSPQSFEMIKTVHHKILDFAGLEKVPCVIVGQKCDLNGERRVTLAEGEALAKKLGAAFVESSARDNKNVGKAFEILLREMQKEYNPAPEKKKASWWGWAR